MKNIKISIAAFALIMATSISCNNTSEKNKAKTNNENRVSTENTVTKKFSIVPIVENYLALQNALAADDSKVAANAGEELLVTLKNVDLNAIPSDKMNPQ